MAVTKLMNIKACPHGAGRHLYNSIRYIMNPEKTKGGMLVGGNSGNDCREVYDVMMDTKKEWGKPDGRQGYHFVLSWKPGEISEEKAYQIVKEFCEEYLGDNYDYVFAIHDDQSHMHGHIVFNSVNRVNGYKYRYERGDWEKYIQPVTDSICERHGLEKLTYDRNAKKGKSYAEYQADKEGRFTWKKIIRSDIDYVLPYSESYEDFLEQMKMIGYYIKTGYSRKECRDYVLFCAPGQDRGWKDKNLGDGYRLEDIKRRIQKETFQYYSPRPPKIKQCRMQPALKGHSYLSWYQVRKVRMLHETSGFFARKNPYVVDQARIRKNLLQIGRLREDCNYLIKSNIRSEAELEQREAELLQEEKLLKNLRSNRHPFREDERYLEYLELQRELKKIPDSDDRFEELQDRLEKLEEELPMDVDQIESEIKSAREQLAAIRQEKRIIRHIKKMDQQARVVVVADPKIKKADTKDQMGIKHKVGQTVETKKGAIPWQKK